MQKNRRLVSGCTAHTQSLSMWAVGEEYLFSSASHLRSESGVLFKFSQVARARVIFRRGGISLMLFAVGHGFPNHALHDPTDAASPILRISRAKSYAERSLEVAIVEESSIPPSKLRLSEAKSSDGDSDIARSGIAPANSGLLNPPSKMRFTQSR